MHAKMCYIIKCISEFKKQERFKGSIHLTIFNIQ